MPHVEGSSVEPMASGLVKWWRAKFHGGYKQITGNYFSRDSLMFILVTHVPAEDGARAPSRRHTLYFFERTPHVLSCSRKMLIEHCDCYFMTLLI